MVCLFDSYDTLRMSERRFPYSVQVSIKGQECDIIIIQETERTAVCEASLIMLLYYKYIKTYYIT